MKDMIKSLSLCAVGSVLIGSAVAQTGSNREEGGVHTHNGNQVFWSAHAHDCPEDCGIGTFMQTRSGALPLPAPSRIPNRVRCALTRPLRSHLLGPPDQQPDQRR